MTARMDDALPTAVAQRRLVEALADLRRAGGLDIGEQDNPLVAFEVGVRFIVDTLNRDGSPDHLAGGRIYAAFADLIAAVDNEQRSTNR